MRLTSLLTVLMLSWLVHASVHAQVPAQPHAGGYTEHAVSQSVDGGTLYGTELIPDGAGKMPVVLLHSGSGPTDRDGNSVEAGMLNNSLRMLAEALARDGIATLRYDKRGVGSSALAVKEEADLRLDTYVDDAVAWMRQLRADRRFSRLVVAGHSEGAQIGVLACQRGKADACVAIAGAGSALDEILREQLKSRLPPALAAQNERILVALKQGREVDDVPPELMALYRPSVQPYLISSLKYDPRVAIGALRMPVLIVQGSTDIQVSVRDAQALSAAAPAARLVIVDGMNHVLKMVDGNPERQLDSYRDPGLPLAPGVSAALIGFVKSN